MEIWKDIPYYAGLYEASNLGRIRSKEGKTTKSARFEKRVWKQRIMKQKAKISKHGRTDMMVCLWKGGKPHYHLVSRLIASTFHEDNLFTSLTVNHKDGNPMNNSANNLEWISRKANIEYGFNNGQYSSFMKMIAAVDEKGVEIYARSYAEMDRKLNQYKGYTSRRIILGFSTLSSKEGHPYTIKK